MASRARHGLHCLGPKDGSHLLHRHIDAEGLVACEQAHLFGYREPAKRGKVSSFLRPILLASSRLRLPVHTREPARRLKVSEEDCLESEDIQLILSVSIVEGGKLGNYPCSQPESSMED